MLGTQQLACWFKVNPANNTGAKGFPCPHVHHTHTCTYVTHIQHAHTRIYTYTCTYTHTHRYTHVYTYPHRHTYTNTHIRIHTHTYPYAYRHTYTNIHTDTHTHACTWVPFPRYFRDAAASLIPSLCLNTWCGLAFLGDNSTLRVDSVSRPTGYCNYTYSRGLPQACPTRIFQSWRLWICALVSLDGKIGMIPIIGQFWKPRDSQHGCPVGSPVELKTNKQTTTKTGAWPHLRPRN